MVKISSPGPQHGAHRTRRRTLTALAIGALAATAALVPSMAQAAGNPHGDDVSSHQGNVNWAATKAAGAQFVVLKATEGTYYTNPYFAQQYNGAYSAGLIRGAYHFAHPERRPPAPRRPTTSSRTAAAGPRTARPCRARWTSSTTPTAPSATA